MGLRVTIQAGSLSVGLSTIGTGLTVTLPDQKWIGWAVVAAGVLALVLDVRIERGHFAVGGIHRKPQRRKMIALVGMILCGAGFVGFGAAYFWPQGQSKMMPSFQSPSKVVGVITQDEINVIEFKAKANKIRMARKWIRLSDDILLDISMTKPRFDMPMIDRNDPPDLRIRLFQQETRRVTNSFQDGLQKMSQKYLGRLEEARMEMIKLGINVSDNNMLIGPPINSFFWEAWAAKLAAEGRHILSNLGAEE